MRFRERHASCLVFFHSAGSFLLALLLVLAVSQSARAQITGVVLEPVGPLFDQPVALRNAGDGSNRLFVVEVRAGVIRWFKDEPAFTTAPIFLDLSDRVISTTWEEGLFGLAFHPDFANNGYFYVNYTADNPLRSVVSRFSVDSNDPSVGDASSEVVLFEVDQPNAIHNGGDLAFGPDGYLYASFGDGGSSDMNSQDLSNLLGTIVRIDVDTPSGGNNYSIPASNPFFGNVDGAREEIFAFGFRNPWRFSISADGRIWAGDVGESSYEEIDFVTSGANYGWPIMEGSSCFESTTCDQTGLTLPIFDYDRTFGTVVTGGYLYRGSSPSLSGLYIFGDLGNRTLHAIDVDGDMSEQLIDTSTPRVVGFGEDEQGELYICSLQGEIFRITEQLGIEITPPSPVDGPSEAFVIGEAYPNPSSGAFAVPVVAMRDAKAHVTVVDILGRTIEAVDLNVGAGEQEIRVNLGHAARGTYFVRIDLPGISGTSTISILD